MSLSLSPSKIYGLSINAGGAPGNQQFCTEDRSNVQSEFCRKLVDSSQQVVLVNGHSAKYLVKCIYNPEPADLILNHIFLSFFVSTMNVLQNNSSEASLNPPPNTVMCPCWVKANCCLKLRVKSWTDFWMVYNTKYRDAGENCRVDFYQKGNLHCFMGLMKTKSGWPACCGMLSLLLLYLFNYEFIKDCAKSS